MPTEPITTIELVQAIAQRLADRRWSASVDPTNATRVRVTAQRGSEWFEIHRVMTDAAWAVRLFAPGGYVVDVESIRVRPEHVHDADWLANVIATTLQQITRRQEAPAPARRGRR